MLGSFRSIILAILLFLILIVLIPCAMVLERIEGVRFESVDDSGYYPPEGL